MNANANTFGSPSGEPSTTRPDASTNVRKNLDTTLPILGLANTTLIHLAAKKMGSPKAPHFG
jgi:hypothetical protein